MPAVSFDKFDGSMVIPAQHPLTLAKQGKAPSLTEPSAVQQVYSPGFKEVLNIPITAITHLPPGDMHITRLVLCANYDAKDPENSCAMGSRCKFVHADANAIKVHEIHVNYAWRSLEQVEYERYPAGMILHVKSPNGGDLTDVMNSCLMLKTKVLELGRSPLAHCAHYYYNRTCNMGADCQFVHAVYIDPNARLHQRAPAPSQIGRGNPQRGVPRGLKTRPPPREMSTLDVTSAIQRDTTRTTQSEGGERLSPPLSDGSDEYFTMGPSAASAFATAMRTRFRRNPYSVSRVIHVQRTTAGNQYAHRVPSL